MRCSRAGMLTSNCRTREILKAKRPLTNHGYKDASTDEAKIRRWWKQHPNAIVGLALGSAGLIVVDTDRHGGPDGVAYLSNLEMANDVLPDHPIVNTRSCGQHHYFRNPIGIGNTEGALKGKGINIRGAVGYVIAAGSVTSEGSWEADPDAPDLLESLKAGTIPDLPEWLVGIIQAAPKAERIETAAESRQEAPATEASTRERAFAEAALDGCYNELAGLLEGERNNTLNAIAYRLGRMVARGWLSEFEVARRLEQAYERNGLLRSDGAKQVRATIRSGLSKGRLDPHPDLPERERVDPVTGEVFEEPAKVKISATPFEWIEPKDIPPRDWMYGTHYIRKYVSMTAARGGIGKSSLDLVEILAMVTGRDLLDIGYKPERKLRAWIWNGEDPKIETQRRVAAICKYYGIKREELEGYLFLDSGRETEIKVAYQDRNGFKIAIPVVEQVTQTILDNQIDVVLVDPFISSHAVGENDTTAIDAVVKTWGKIADKTDSGVELVHHMRKGAVGQHNHEIGDARGAGSGVDAVRSARVVNVMDKENADSFGIDQDERESYLKVTNGKPNMAKKSGKGIWYRLESVNLGNSTKTREADEVGVVTRWKVPSATGEVTGADIQEILDRIGDVPIHREDVQAKMWAGKVVADVLGLDVKEKGTKDRIKKILKGCIKSGQLKTVPGLDAKRETRRYIVKGIMADFGRDSPATH